jgi:hypothetical protein
MHSTFREPAVKRALVFKRASAVSARSRAATRDARLGALALIAIVACSAFVLIAAADRPSLLSATTHGGYFPHWMAGPLGGLWPGLTRNGTMLKYLFTGAVAIMYGAYLLGLRYVPRLHARWAIAAIVAVHAIFFLAPPLALTDIFNYVNYGRMEVVHHLNPYTTIPILEPHSDPSYVLSNWHQLLSPYGPLFTLLTFAVVPLGVAASFWALKGLLAIASLGTIWLVWRCARLLGRDPVAAIVLVGLNPIVLVWGLGGDHNDFLMVFFIMLGFYLLLLSRAQTTHDAPPTARSASAAGSTSTARSASAAGSTSTARSASAAGSTSTARSTATAASTVAARPSPTARLRGWLLPLSVCEIGAGAAFVTATAIKASGGVLIPVVLAGLLRAPRRLVQVLLGVAVAVVIVAAASLIAFGLHIPDLSTQGRLVTNESIPNLIGLAIGAGGESEVLRQLMSGLLAISILYCCWLVWRPRPGAESSTDAGVGLVDRLLTSSGWASVALLVTLSWVLPWYVLWVLPLAALSSSRRLRTTALVLGVYLIVAWSPASGLLWNAIGFYPNKTPVGRLHQRYVKELLN